MAASFLETVCYVAFVGAVFTLGITIRGELLTTTGTLETVHGFFVNAFRMIVPPVQTALTAAKAFFLFSFRLLQFLTAKFTAVRCRLFGTFLCADTITPAIAFHGIPGKLKI
jgi:hypothetical protein